MQLGFVSAILAEQSLDEVLALASREGFSTVELMCWPIGRADRKYAGVTHVNVCDFTQSKADALCGMCALYGVSISGLGYYPNMLDPHQDVSGPAVAHFKKVIAAASLLGVHTVNGFVGRDWTQTVDDNWPQFLETWKPVVRWAEDYGVRIGIENCPMLFTRDEWPGGKNLLTTPAIWRRAFNDIPSASFGLNYDPSHLVLQDIDPISPLAEFKDKIFHLHAKDIQIDRAALSQVGRFDFPLRWHHPRIPGHGEIDWGRFMAEVKRIGYDAAVCIEVEDDAFARGLDGHTQALRAARDVLLPLIH